MNFILQQPQPPPPPAPAPPAPAATMRDQIREQVREQVEAARLAAQAAVADQTGTPVTDAAVTTQPVMPPWQPTIPPQAVDISLMFFITVFAIIVGWPIARAIARAMDRRGQQPRISPEIHTQLAQLTQSVEAIAIEVERISEGQRFTTKLLSEQQGRRSSLAAGD